jgi:hypothetical protein
MAAMDIAVEDKHHHSRRRSARRSLAVGAAVGVALAAVPSSASAEATVTRFSYSVQEVFDDAPPECMPTVKSGVTVATSSGQGQVTETDNVFALRLSDSFVYRTDFADGSYLAGAARGHISFIQTGSRTIFTDVVQEPRTIYSSDGEPLGQVMIHALTHVTVDDATGAATASVDRFFFTCS